jgi:hypothetical protein
MIANAPSTLCCWLRVNLIISSVIDRVLGAAARPPVVGQELGHDYKILVSSVCMLSTRPGL